MTIHQSRLATGDVLFHLGGTDFVWNIQKAAANRLKHSGVSFEQAASAQGNSA